MARLAGVGGRVVGGCIGAGIGRMHGLLPRIGFIKRKNMIVLFKYDLKTTGIEVLDARSAYLERATVVVKVLHIVFLNDVCHNVLLPRLRVRRGLNQTQN